eukprot:s2244_g7.t1
MGKTCLQRSHEAVQMASSSETSDERSDRARRGPESGGPEEGSHQGTAEPSPAEQLVETARSAAIPDRVKVALEAAADFGKFREGRVFRFLHVFSGPDDRLAVALEAEGKRAGLTVKVESLDNRIDPDLDLRRHETVEALETRINQLEFDGYHAGFPCGSFSRVRWVEAANLPGYGGERSAGDDGLWDCRWRPRSASTSLADGRADWRKVCGCPAWVKHVPVTGKATTLKAGIYPDKLCQEVAKLYVAAWKRTLELEFWRWKLLQKAEEVSSLKTGWLKNEEKKISERQRTMGPRRIGHVDEEYKTAEDNTATVAMNPERETAPSSSVGESKRLKREAENEFCIGGMRNLWMRQSSEWQVKLSTLLGVCARDGMTLQDKLMFKSPLNVDLWRAWFKETGDPDYHVAEWAEQGVRSGGNLRTHTPERIVLPRIVDVTRMDRDLATKNQQDNQRRSAEFVMYDLQDAFCHFPVSRPELANCLAPGNRPNQAILFRALLFGFKSAPLLMRRLSAAVGRVWQSLMSPTEGQLQIYVDDVLTLINGTDEEKANLIALSLYTMRALGVQIALGKGERGQQVQWIGVKMLLQWTPNPTEGSITYSAPKKMIDEVLETLKGWMTRGMVSHRELRSTTGRLSWICGILPRLRWTASVLFAVLRDAEEDERSGAEESRASRRPDTRPKLGLVAVKRFGATLKWLIAALSRIDKFALRREDLCETPAYEAKFTESEAALLGVKHGDSSSQGTVEALAILRAVNLWRTKVQNKAIFVRSDSVVALAMSRQLKGSTPQLNFVGGELSISLEDYNVKRLVAQHLPRVMNTEPDWLSRQHDRSPEIPAALRKVKIKQLPPMTSDNFVMTPPGARYGAWEGLPPHHVSVFHSL